MSDARSSLTTDERFGLRARINLADAHCRQSIVTREELELIHSLGAMFEVSAKRDYVELELEAGNAFLSSMGQIVPVGRRPIAVYTSSVATMIVARAIRRRGLETSLTMPTFDNIAALLMSEGIRLRPIRTHPLEELDGLAACVFVVSPNNPTGDYLNETSLAALAAYCASTGRVLVLDQSFRGQVSDACFDHYQILERAGASYVVIEDTGKLWPVQDIKCSFIICSADLQNEIEGITDDVLLNIAPIVLEFVRKFADLSGTTRYSSLRELLRDNRIALREKLQQFDIEVPYPDSEVSVEVLRFRVNNSVRRITDRAQSGGLAVLDAAKFYWSEDLAAGGLLRVSLARDRSYFGEGIDVLVDALEHERRWGALR